jgi:hypothetical protein
MVLKTKELMGLIGLDTYKFKHFQGINRKDIEKLNRNGIETAAQILEIGSTKEGRHKLSKLTNIPVDSILELVKLSDPARIPGAKKVRARLYYEAGFDTLAKMATCDPEKLIKISAGFIKKTERHPTNSKGGGTYGGFSEIPKEICRILEKWS